MHRLTFNFKPVSKGLYYDGHERADVVLYRQEYNKRINQYIEREVTYIGENMDEIVYPTLKGSTREIVRVYQDECTLHTGEENSKAWLSDKDCDIKRKSEGKLMHLSDFTEKKHGRLCLPSNMQSTIPHRDAAIVTYPGVNGDSYWNCSQLIEQLKTRAIPIFEALNPNCQALFIFDCSSAHESFSTDALWVTAMNFKPGGSTTKMRDTIIPSDDPHIPIELRGTVQSMNYPIDHSDKELAGESKGIRQVLMERGLLDYYNNQRANQKLKPLVSKCAKCRKTGRSKDKITRAERLIQNSNIEDHVEDCSTKNKHPPEDDGTYCCASKILMNQSDFKNERPMLQVIIEEAGHLCMFLPKFHCEWNPIELVWCYTKGGKAHSFLSDISSLISSEDSN